MRVSVPTINDRSTDFDRLIDLWNNAISTRTDVIFDFSECGFLRQNAVACLGGLARMIQRRGKNISFATTTMSDAVRMNLAQNGFLSMCNVGTSPWQGNSIPYREDQTQCTEAVVDYLRMQWLGRGWVSVSPGLRDAIVGVVWEIYANAFEHSRSPVGVISCGQFYPTLQLLKLAVLDCGVGIPNTVRAYKSSWQIPADRAVKWAFQRGASTRPGPGGMGLDVLKSSSVRRMAASKSTATRGVRRSHAQEKPTKGAETRSRGHWSTSRSAVKKHHISDS